MEKIKDNIPMGLGELGSPTLTFVRKFHFLLNLENLGDQWIKKVKIDYHNKILNFEVLEVHTEGKIPVLEWLKNPGKSATFATYDGCGKALYAFKFDGLVITEQYSDFDYAVSNESSVKISMVFESCKPIDLSVDAENVERKSQPNVHPAKEWEIDETEINHLNASMCLPGKAKPKVN